MSNEVKESFVYGVGFIFDQMVSSKSAKMKIKIISKFKPLELLESLVSIYASMNQNL